MGRWQQLFRNTMEIVFVMGIVFIGGTTLFILAAVWFKWLMNTLGI